MFRLFGNTRLLGLLALLSLNASLMACECCDPYDCSRLYVGAFGGGIYLNSTKVSQMGTAFSTQASGGPLAVNARGHTKGTSSGLGGAQIGYEWSTWPRNIGYTDWSIASAVEMEAFWYSYTAEGRLTNPTNRLPEHAFYDSFRVDTGVYLANAVFSLNNANFGPLSPYVGAGIGATRLSIRNATGTQVAPPEPTINHFNSKTSDSSWAFAAQAKAGLRYHVSNAFHVFGEYRYLFVDSSNYIFGSAVYPTHVPTSPWNVKVNITHCNAFVFGIQYDL